MLYVAVVEIEIEMVVNDEWRQGVLLLHFFTTFPWWLDYCAFREGKKPFSVGHKYKSTKNNMNVSNP